MLEEKNLPYISVSDVNNLIKYKLESDISLRNIYVKGEISNWKVYRSGAFFDLKDQNGSVLPCIIWSSYVDRIGFSPKDGDEVIIFGNITVYSQRGRYSLQAYSIQLFGKGSALLALEALKKKLAKEGLFDESRKRMIPKMPKKIGIIVGKDSAAESDLKRNIHRRWPLTEIYLFYAQVQGKEAPKSIIKALKASSEYDLDALIVARGGGSSEDLSAFNDEELVRAFSKCKTPFISAVGHEIDVTLIDYVADLRVSTPTGAAEAATPDQQEIRNKLLDYEDELNTQITDKLSYFREKISFLSKRSFFLNPASICQKEKEDIKKKGVDIEKSLEKKIGDYRMLISSYEARLKAINPDNVIKRGYSMTLSEDGMPITSKKYIKNGQKIKTRLKDGIIISRVLDGGE